MEEGKTNIGVCLRDWLTSVGPGGEEGATWRERRIGGRYEAILPS